MAQAQLSSSTTQRPAFVNTPTKIIMQNNDFINNVQNVNGDVTIQVSGTYFVVASPQVNKLNANGQFNDIDFWIVVNNNPVPNSGVRISMSNRKETDVIVSQGIIPLNSGDVLNVYMNVVNGNNPCCYNNNYHGGYSYVPNNSQIGIVAIQPSNQTEAFIPSIIFSLFKLA